MTDRCGEGRRAEAMCRGGISHHPGWGTRTADLCQLDYPAPPLHGEIGNSCNAAESPRGVTPLIFPLNPPQESRAPGAGGGGAPIRLWDGAVWVPSAVPGAAIRRSAPRYAGR